MIVVRIKSLSRISDHKLLLIAKALYEQQESSPFGLGRSMKGKYLHDALSVIQDKYSISYHDLIRIIALLHKNGAIRAVIEEYTDKTVIKEVHAGASADFYIQNRMESNRNFIWAVAGTVISACTLVISIVSLCLSLSAKCP